MYEMMTSYTLMSMSIPKPISDQQLALNRSLHEMNPAFGNREQAAGVAARLPLALLRMHQIGL